ncbi:MAG: hypothetical protein MR266_00380 [Erysipelotrichaceae bacterium]|nr:hypothetical protein [Erysipelotrichaceae bacterium]
MDYNISYDVNKLDELVQDANNFYTNVKTKKESVNQYIKNIIANWEGEQANLAKSNLDSIIEQLNSIEEKALKSANMLSETTENFKKIKY